MAEKTAGRGRLSSIDLLPDEATPHVRDAIEALKERKRLQEDIREELNTHLLALGLKPISRSAFNRKALQVAAYGRQLIQAREVAAIMAEKLDQAPDSDVGLLLGETIKSLVYDVVMNESLEDGAASVVVLKEASLALQRLERARHTNVRTRSEIEREIAARAIRALDDAADAGKIDIEAAQRARQIMGFVEE